MKLSIGVFMYLILHC